MTKTKEPSLNEIADRIDAHLKRFEADKKINRRTDGQTRYYCAGAARHGSYVYVKYISYQNGTSLTKHQAIAYLNWLDAGNAGSHYRAVEEFNKAQEREVESRVTKYLYVVYDEHWNSKEPRICKAAIVKETDKQYQIDYGDCGYAFGYRSRIERDSDRYALNAERALSIYLERQREKLASLEHEIATCRSRIEWAGGSVPARCQCRVETA